MQELLLDIYDLLGNGRGRGSNPGPVKICNTISYTGKCPSLYTTSSIAKESQAFFQAISEADTFTIELGPRPRVALNLTIAEARGLATKDISGLNDPFCTVYVRSSRVVNPQVRTRKAPLSCSSIRYLEISPHIRQFKITIIHHEALLFLGTNRSSAGIIMQYEAFCFITLIFVPHSMVRFHVLL